MSFIVLLVLAAVVGYYVWKLMKNRAAAFAAAADRLGYTYSAHDSPFRGTDIDGLSLITGESPVMAGGARSTAQVPAT